MKQYTFNGKVFYQKKLSLGQVRSISTLIDDVHIPVTSEAVDFFKGLLITLGDKLSLFVSVVLKTDDPDLQTIEKKLEFIDEHVTMDDFFVVVEDFLEFNPTSSYLPKIMKVFGVQMDEEETSEE